MTNRGLADDYLLRAEHRLAAVELLAGRGAFADAVRQAQETVELALKALLRLSKVEVPRVHDVGEILLENKRRVPERVREHVEKFAEISRQLRRDRELAFYGSEDLTPSDFYKKGDADRALADARFVVEKLKVLRES